MIVKCIQCGREFKRSPSHVKTTNNYCTIKCHHKYQHEHLKSPLGSSHEWIIRSCNNCGEYFKTQVKTINRGGGKYCSKKCNPSYAPQELPSNKYRRYNLRNNYGITVEEFDRMVEDHNGVCAICGEPPGGKHKILNIDHNHSNGEIRGLLCTNCNRALGWFRDDPIVLGKALDYVLSANS